MQSWTSDEVPKEYEYGKPFLPFNLMCELPWPMRLMHEWYLTASELGLGMITVHVSEDAFKDGPNANFAFTFKDLHAFFKMDKMDINLVGTWCLEHYILFLVYPTDQTIVVLDPADYGKDAYMEFLCLLNLAHGRYKKRGGYVKNPSREKLYIRGRWPCYKQPSLTNLCGYYVCEMLRVNGRYKTEFTDLLSIPYSGSQFDQKTLINLCVDLCRFIRRDICNHLGEFYDPHSELATDPKFKNLREWEREHDVD
uniref:Ubiquitin-like protease family profile domain-containing protein n=1 Tax=Oryza glaberrima TaxID=4538 RepID=I1QGZ5_ORYGL